MVAKLFFGASVVFSVLVLVFSDFDCFKPTPDLPNTIMKRCKEYLANYRSLDLIPNWPLKSQEEKFCKYTLDTFLKAFAHRDACEVEPDDYDDFFKVGGFSNIRKLLFWSKTQDLSLKLADGGRHVVVLANTFQGYLTTDLVWCGDPDKKSKDGINYKRCPQCKEKKKREHFEVYWGKASEWFAIRASGLVSYLTSGTVGTTPPLCAYHTDTFFYKHELAKLNFETVTKFRVIVANEPGKKVFENCEKGTVVEVLNEIKRRLKFSPECVENPPDVMEIFCNDPKYKYEKECILFKGKPRKENGLVTPKKRGHKSGR